MCECVRDCKDVIVLTTYAMGFNIMYRINRAFVGHST